MRTLLTACLLLSLVMATKMSHAECTIIEHDNSTEVVCVGDKSLPVSTPIEGKRITPNLQTEQALTNKALQLEQERQEERCTLEYNLCYSPCTDNATPKSLSSCNSRCQSAQAQCKLSAISNSLPETKSKCKKRCSLEYDICYIPCTDNATPKSLSSCSSRCQSTRAQCDMQCI